MALNESDIESIVQSGEAYHAEFKIRVPNKVKELAEEVCAFANAAGGFLLLGIDNENRIQGIEISNSKRSAIQDAIQHISPNLYCPFYFVEVDSKKVGVIEVPSGLQKPYTLSGAIYIRQGTNSQKITSVEQMRDFFQQSGRIYFDEGDCPNFSFEKDLNKAFFEEFRLVAKFSPSIPDLQIIRNLKLINENESFKNGSVLFFGKHPETFFNTAVIRCVAFEGTDKVQIRDDKTWGGSLMLQYRDALQWLKNKLDIRYIIEGSGPRKEVWEIPETALKEAIINALSHRDYYEKGARTMIELFDDRLEITNPGGLVSAISPEEFGTKSVSRNPLLFGLFQRMYMVEQIGSGINRIKSALNKAKLPEPKFKTKGMFNIVFRRPSKDISQKTSVKTSVKIMEYIQDNPNITIPELADKINKTTRTIEMAISKLKNEGRLKRIGPDKGGYWQVIKP